MSNIAELKEIYIRSQIKVNTLIEQQIKEDTNKKVETITREGGANSRTFWNIRRKLINHNRNEDYTTKDENGKKIDSASISLFVVQYLRCDGRKARLQ